MLLMVLNLIMLQMAKAEEELVVDWTMIIEELDLIYHFKRVFLSLILEHFKFHIYFIHVFLEYF